MNKVLRFSELSRRSIPYRPFLRPYCKSAAGCLLYEQLEFWSAKYPDGFYKFMTKPTSPHRLYKEGDSFEEEIGFSPDEFRTAFDNIGVRYKSKTEFNNAPDKFQGKYYCSYTDKIERVTWYYRNHSLANGLFEHFLYGREGLYSPEMDIPIPRNGGEDILHPNGNSNSPKWIFPFPGMDIPMSILYTENTTENTTEITNIEPHTFSQSPRAAESETSTRYNWEPTLTESNRPSIENQQKSDQPVPTSPQPSQNTNPPSQDLSTPTIQINPDLDQLTLSQKEKKDEISNLASGLEKPPHGFAATPPSSKGKQKKNTLLAEQEAIFLAIYLEERSSNMVKHQNVPEGAKKHLFDLTQKYPDNYYDVFRGGMQSLREREDSWWRDEKKTFTLVNLMTEGRFIGFYETHLLDMERNSSYIRRVQGLAPSKDKGRQQMSVLDESGKPVSNELAQLATTYQNADPALLMILGLGKQEDL